MPIHRAVHNSHMEVLDYVCDVCRQGKMRPLPHILLSDPPQYPHRCNKCGHQRVFNGIFPRLQVNIDEQEAKGDRKSEKSKDGESDKPEGISSPPDRFRILMPEENDFPSVVARIVQRQKESQQVPESHRDKRQDNLPEEFHAGKNTRTDGVDDQPRSKTNRELDEIQNLVLKLKRLNRKQHDLLIKLSLKVKAMAEK